MLEEAAAYFELKKLKWQAGLVIQEEKDKQQTPIAFAPNQANVECVVIHGEL